MSAIFGILHRDGKPVSREDLGRMDAALEAFGSDGHGIWSNGHIGLGQREMHFTPEDRFNQLPLKSADGQRVLVCDARVDNRPELMHLLDIRPTDAKEMPDSAFIMRAYKKWGIDCAKHLIGDIAFALWDQREQRLLLARSPVGGRSMYYYSTPDLFAFSTMPKGLFAIPSIPRELDLEYIAAYLTMTGTEPGSSFYNNIQKLQTGHLLTIDCRGLHKHTFWKLDPLKELHYTREDDYVEAFNELFERVVSDHLRSLTPIGVMMSGGLDSTTVAAVAATQLKQKGMRLATYTEVPRDGFDGAIVAGRYADETPLIQAMARHYDNLDLNLIRTDGRMYLEGLDLFFEASNIPFRNASNRIWYETILQKARNQGVRILLTGAQGNLTISRNGQGLLPQLIRYGKWWQAIRESSAMQRQNPIGSTLRSFVNQGIMPLLPTPLWRTIQGLRGKLATTPKQQPWHKHSVINPDFANYQRVLVRAKEKGNNFLFRPNPNQRSTISKLLPTLASAGNEVNQSYRALFGIEVRDPTADVRLAEFCLSLPEDQYQRKGVSRRLIRQSMANRLPAEVLENKLRGLQAADWFECLFGAREQIMCTLDGWNNSKLVSSIIDLNRLKNLAIQMDQYHGNAKKKAIDYRMVMEFGLMTGSFIRWVETKGNIT